jgi:TRAP-type C4-dicarboxylate transport system permease small subunit
VDALKAFDKFCGVLDAIATVITVALMVFLTVLITAAVISRWIFNSPIAWQYEATLVCLSWVVFIGMSITFKLDEHMRLTFVSNAMSPKVRNIWLAIMDLITLLFLAYAGYESISVVENAMPTLYQTIPVSRGLFYMPFPIGCAFSVCHIINTNYKRLTGKQESASSVS